MTAQLLADLIPALVDLGDGCPSCVGGTITEINKIIEKYGYRYIYTCDWKSKPDYDFENHLCLEQIL
jgi:hypothetical protein